MKIFFSTTQIPTIVYRAGSFLLRFWRTTTKTWPSATMSRTRWLPGRRLTRRLTTRSNIVIVPMWSWWRRKCFRRRLTLVNKRRLKSIWLIRRFRWVLDNFYYFDYFIHVECIFLENNSCQAYWKAMKWGNWMANYNMTK